MKIIRSLCVWFFFFLSLVYIAVLSLDFSILVSKCHKCFRMASWLEGKYVYTYILITGTKYGFNVCAFLFFFIFWSHTIEKPVLKMERVLRWHLRLFGFMWMHTVWLFFPSSSIQLNFHLGSQMQFIYMNCLCFFYALHCYSTEATLHWQYSCQTHSKCYSPAHYTAQSCRNGICFDKLNVAMELFSLFQKKKRKTIYFPIINKIHCIENLFI